MQSYAEALKDTRFYLEKRRVFLTENRLSLGGLEGVLPRVESWAKQDGVPYVKQAGARSVFLGHLLMSAVGSGFWAVLPVVSNSQPAIGNSFSDGRRLDKLQERPFRQRCVRSWHIAIRHLPRG